MDSGTTREGYLKNKSILDSGETRLMTNKIDLLTIVRWTDISVEIGDESVVRVLSIGTLEAKAVVEGETGTVYILTMWLSSKNFQ